MLPNGLFNVNYGQDIAIVRTKLQWGLVAILLVFLLVLPFVISDRALGIVNSFLIPIIAVQGLNIITGYCGQISLGQAAFMAIGGYTSAILADRLGFPFWLSLPCSGLMAGLVGLIFALPAVRIKGFYLAMATVAAQFIIGWAVFLLPDLTGGVNGLIVPLATLGGFQFSSERDFFYLFIAAVIVATLISKNLARTKVGRSFVAVRDNDLAAGVMGVNPFTSKLLAFFICSTYAGVAGSLWVHYVGVCNMDHFSFNNSIWYVGMAIVGGLGSAIGPILGVLFLKGIETLVGILGPILTDLFPAVGYTTSVSLGLVIQAGVIMLFLIYEPRGMAHRWETFKSSYRLWPFPYWR